jgi:hypothetical protein
MVLDFITFLSMNIITLLTLVLLRHLGGVIFGFFSYSILPFLLLWQKMGSNFWFGPGLYFLPVKWFLFQNGQRGSFLVFVLATFCWTKSLLCNVTAFTRMLFYSKSTLQLWASRRLCVEFKSVSSVPLHPSRRRGIPSRRSSVSNIHPNEENFPSGCPSVSRSFEQFKFASVLT